MLEMQQELLANNKAAMHAAMDLAAQAGCRHARMRASWRTTTQRGHGQVLFVLLYSIALATGCLNAFFLSYAPRFRDCELRAAPFVEVS